MTTKTQNLEAFINQMKESLNQDKAAILVGAGISMIYPSMLPSGKQLKEIVLESLLIGEFAKNKRLLRYNKMYNEIIPEVLFTEIHSVVQKKIFPIFNLLGLASPNEIHSILAQLHRAYIIPIYTTNFDLLIDGFLPSNTVYHLHGDLNEISELYVILKRIISGIPLNKWMTSWKQLRGKNLFVLGYSGNDKDVLNFVDKSDVLKILWLTRTHDINVRMNAQEMVNKQTLFFEGDLNDFTNQVYLKLPELQRASVASPIRNIAQKRKEIIENYRASVSSTQVSLILIRIFHRIGMYKKSIELGNTLLQNPTLTIHEYCRVAVLTADVLRISTNGYTRALQLIDDILAKEEAKASFGYVEVLNCKAVILLTKAVFENPSIPKTAIFLLNEAINYLKRDQKVLDSDATIGKERCQIIKSFIYQNLGLSYYILKDFPEAKRFLLKSLYLKRRIGHLNGIISSSRSLAILSYAMKSRSYSYWKKEALILIDKYSLVK
ncbi:MAG: hypothetical protein EOO43_12595, partial [Flavobacterium sp.]